MGVQDTYLSSMGNNGIFVTVLVLSFCLPFESTFSRSTTDVTTIDTVFDFSTSTHQGTINKFVETQHIGLCKVE